jgi:hypothetical protein
MHSQFTQAMPRHPGATRAAAARSSAARTTVADLEAPRPVAARPATVAAVPTEVHAAAAVAAEAFERDAMDALPPAVLAAAAPAAPSRSAPAAARRPKSVRVAACSSLSRPQALHQALRGGSHAGYNCFGAPLQLAGDVLITGPAVITKRGGRLLCEVLPGGHLDTQQHERLLTGVQEVLGDAQGRLLCSLAAQHVELFGAMILGPSMPYTMHRSKKVLTVSRMQEGDAVLLGAKGKMAYPVNISRTFEHV